MRRTRLAAALGAATVLALTGCGSDGGGGDDFADAPVEEIEQQVKDDMAAVESLTMRGDITEGEQEMSLDLTADTDGNCTGTIAFAGRGSAEFIRADGNVYLKGDEEFWNSMAGGQAAQVQQLLGDKWAQVPEGQAGNFTEFCDLNNLLDELTEEDGEDGAEVTKGETQEVDGQEALELRSEEDGETTQVWVATEDPHRILRMEHETEGSFEFSDFDVPVDAQAPSEDEVVDLGQAG